MVHLFTHTDRHWNKINFWTLTSGNLWTFNRLSSLCNHNHQWCLLGSGLFRSPNVIIPEIVKSQIYSRISSEDHRSTGFENSRLIGADCLKYTTSSSVYLVCKLRENCAIFQTSFLVPGCSMHGDETKLAQSCSHKPGYFRLISQLMPSQWWLVLCTLQAIKAIRQASNKI